jgi:hypothetical protein
MSLTEFSYSEYLVDSSKELEKYVIVDGKLLYSFIIPSLHL